jgi:hypothetical protein
MNSNINLVGCRILLVEDEYLIGFDLRNELLDCGAEVIGPVGDLDMAFDLVQTEGWLDAAILDLNLRGELAFPLADQLIRRGVPFVFTTGYGTEVIPYRLQHIMRCEKPVRSGHLAHMIAGIVSGPGAHTIPA